MLRFRNQPYHGLLDWRLGLAYLAALESSNFQCGLDNNFEAPYLRTWKTIVDRDVARVRREFGKVEEKEFAGLKAVRFDSRARWALIGHPLWDPSVPRGLLSEAILDLGGEPFAVVDSFNMARRPVTVRNALLDWKSR
jgi:hypothetical protein